MGALVEQRRLTVSRQLTAADPKILVIDIERLPGLARVWDQRTNFIPISQWTQLPTMLCFSAKWVGRKPAEFHAAWDSPGAMVERSWELFDEADAVVTFNGDRFDIPHLKGAWLEHGLTPPSPVKSIDLFKYARQFGFESKSLAHLCHRLGIDGKDGRYDAVAAEACMSGDPKARRDMKRYNAGDVKITEDCYWRILPWIHNHPTLSIPSDEVTPRCNKCHDGGDLERRGTYLANQIRYIQYHCRQCGGWIRGGRHSRASGVFGVK